MRLACLIESLQGGGAERQLCNVAVGLKRRGWDIRFVTYAPGEFYSELLAAEGIERIELKAANRWQRFAQVRRYLQGNEQDAVLAFLPGPSVWAALAGLPRKRWALVTSERLALPASQRAGWRARLHGLSDRVTTNSHSNRLILEDLNPSLRGRVTTIYNGVPLDHFAPAPPSKTATASPMTSLVSAGSLVKKKNMATLIKGLALVRRRRPDAPVELRWYGSHPAGDRSAYEEALRLVRDEALQDRVFFEERTQDIRSAYRKADAMVHPSFYEGLPNAVCEGMACGLPVLMSGVGDAGNLVIPGANGFLFDPSSPEDAAAAITRFLDLGPAARRAMGAKSRAMAETLFDNERFVRKYAEVLEAAARRSDAPIGHWPATVPETATAFLRSR